MSFLMGGVFDHEKCPKVVQDGPKVLPDRSWIDPTKVNKLENLVRDRAQNDLCLVDPGAPPSYLKNSYRALGNLEKMTPPSLHVLLDNP